MNNEVNNESPVTPENQTPTPINNNPVDSTVQPVNPTNVEVTPTIAPTSPVPSVGQTPVENFNNSTPISDPMANLNNNMPINNQMPIAKGYGDVNNPTPKAKAFGPAPIIIAVVVVVALIAGIATKVATSSPKAVFKGQINNAFKAFNNALDDYDEFNEKFDLSSNSLNMKGSLKFDTNVESSEADLELLKKMTIAAELGIDINQERLYVGGSVKGDKNTLGVKAIYQDKNAYLDTTFYDKVVKIDSEEVDFTEIKEAFAMLNEQMKDYDPKSYDKIVDKINKAINKSIDSKNLKKSSGKFEVDGKSVSATKNSLTLDEQALEDMITVICDELLNDDDFLKTFADTMNIEKGDVKEALKSLKDSAKDIQMEDDIVINIWTKGLINSCVGFSVEVDEKEYLSFYKDDKKSEFIINNHSKIDSEKIKLVATFEENKKEISFNVKLNGEKIASGTIREMSDKLVDFDLSIESAGQKFKLSVYLSKEEDKKSIKGDYKVRVSFNDEYIEVSGDYEISSGSIPDIDTSKVVDSNSISAEEVVDSLKDIVEEDETLNKIIGSGITELEKESLNLNYINMNELRGADDAIKILKNTKASVLYVGSTYYSSYSNVDAYNLLESLIDAQTELDFYSNYLSYLDVNDDFKEAVKDVQYKCQLTPVTTPDAGTTPSTNDPVTENPTCEELPAIYLIKDGEVKKAYRGTVSTQELVTALKEIGIE